MPKKHVLALGGVVVAAVLAAWLIPGRNNAPTTAPANSQAQLPLGQGQAPAQQSNNGGPAIEFAGNSQPMPLPLGGNSQPVMRGPLAEAAGSGEGDGEDGGPAANQSLQPPTVTTTAPPAGAAAGPAPAMAQTPVPVPVPSPRPAPAAKPAPAPAAKPAPAQTQVATAKPAPAAAAKPATAPASAGGTWYAGQAATHYVVQILGTSSEATAQSYIKEQGAEYRYFKKTLQGKPLYVVTYGSFADRNAALAAIKVLPAKVQAGKPWPRTVGSIQQELAATR